MKQELSFSFLSLKKLHTINQTQICHFTRCRRPYSKYCTNFLQTHNCRNQSAKNCCIWFYNWSKHSQFTMVIMTQSSSNIYLILRESFDPTYDIWMSFFISTLQTTVYSNIRIKKYIMKVMNCLHSKDYCYRFQGYAEISLR